MNFKSGVKQNMLRIALWIAAIAWLAFCFFLSWQNGGDTAGLSWIIAEFFMKILKNVGLAFQVEQFHKYLRLFAHFGIFFVAGTLFAGAMEVSLPQNPNRERNTFCAAAGICSFAAVLAEVGKLAVPGRHLTWSEAGLNVVGAICGAAIVSGIVWFVKNVKQRKGLQQN